MVAIIRCTDDEAALIAQRLRHHGSDLALPWTTVRPRRHWRKGSHQTLIILPALREGSLVGWIGWTRRVRQVDDLGEKLEISRIHSVGNPVRLDAVVDRLTERERRAVIPDGQLSDAVGRRLAEALLQIRPDLREILERVKGPGPGFRFGDSPAGAVLALQRDASIGAVRMAGFDSDSFAAWQPPSEPLDPRQVPPPFVEGTPVDDADDTPIEDVFIAHDATTMFGWLSQNTRHLAWRKLVKGDQTLLVANANRSTAESTLGVDLIYYNVARRSMTMLQYKKLSAPVNGFYYPNSDDDLADELAQMRAVDAAAEKFREPNDEFRFVATPSWIKICHPGASIPQTDQMVHGMYLSRDHFERLRSDPRIRDGRGGAARFGYKNVPSYLDNTMFSRLVETGFIGTTGTSTEFVHNQVLRSLDRKKALVLATLSGTDEPQSVRNTRRRQGR